MQALNSEMSEALLAMRQDNKVIQSRLDAELRRERVLGSREFAFPLFPDAYCETRCFRCCPGNRKSLLDYRRNFSSPPTTSQTERSPVYVAQESNHSTYRIVWPW